MMGGWKTWAAAIGAVVLGVYEIADGRAEEGLGHIVFGFGLVGLGHKIEKNGLDG